MVNVRDLGGIRHTFKLLVFPEARLFQCANGEAKQVHSNNTWSSILNIMTFFSTSGMDGCIRERQERS